MWRGHFHIKKGRDRDNYKGHYYLFTTIIFKIHSPFYTQYLNPPSKHVKTSLILTSATFAIFLHSKHWLIPDLRSVYRICKNLQKVKKISQGNFYTKREIFNWILKWSFEYIGQIQYNSSLISYVSFYLESV